MHDITRKRICALLEKKETNKQNSLFFIERELCLPNIGIEAVASLSESLGVSVQVTYCNCRSNTNAVSKIQRGV